MSSSLLLRDGLIVLGGTLCLLVFLWCALEMARDRRLKRTRRNYERVTGHDPAPLKNIRPWNEWKRD